MKKAQETHTHTSLKHTKLETITCKQKANKTKNYPTKQYETKKIYKNTLFVCWLSTAGHGASLTYGVYTQ